MATNLDLINAALTRTGNSTIASLASSKSGAAIASQNYEIIVRGELSSYRWRFATKTQAFNRIDGTPQPPWSAAYQLPSDLLLLRTAQVGGGRLTYEQQGDKILANTGSDADVIGVYTWRVPEAVWPAFFEELIVRRLEPLFLRGIGERADAAEAREKAADTFRMQARVLDAQSETPVDPRTNALLRARGGGAWPERCSRA